MSLPYTRESCVPLRTSLIIGFVSFVHLRNSLICPGYLGLKIILIILLPSNTRLRNSLKIYAWILRPPAVWFIKNYFIIVSLSVARLSNLLIPRGARVPRQLGFKNYFNTHLAKCKTSIKIIARLRSSLIRVNLASLGCLGFKNFSNN